MFEQVFAKLHHPSNRSFCKRPEHGNVKVKIAAKNARKNPVTFVSHERFAVLFFLLSDVPLCKLTNVSSFALSYMQKVPFMQTNLKRSILRFL